MAQLLHTYLLAFIHGYLTFIDKLNHQSACKRFHLLQMIDLFNIDAKYMNELNDMILLKYTDATQLMCNDTITNLNHIP